MDNHIHLLVRASDKPISKAMQNFSFRLAGMLNRKYHKVGHQFQGRFKSILITDDKYLMHLVKYIHLNPVKAKIVDSPEDYYWSSHGHYLGIEKISWITTSMVLSLFASNLEHSVIRYELYMANDLDRNVINIVSNSEQNGVFIGDPEKYFDLVDNLQSNNMPQYLNIKLEDIVNFVCDAFAYDRKLISNKNKDRDAAFVRGVIAYFTLEFQGLTIAELATLTNRHHSILSRQAKKISHQVEYDLQLRMKIDLIWHKLSHNVTIDP